jgi:DNA-binding PucR family transcriptional regulator
MIEAIAHGVPGYASRAHPDYHQRLTDAVTGAVAVLRGRRLAPLARLRPGQRDRIAETLLAWLQLGENAAEVAQRLHVHPQTVRYRMRQIRELFGDQLRDPDRRFELQLALRIRTLSAGQPSD